MAVVSSPYTKTTTQVVYAFSVFRVNHYDYANVSMGYFILTALMRDAVFFPERLIDFEVSDASCE